MVKNTQGTAILMILFLLSVASLLSLVAVKELMWANTLHEALYEKDKQFRFAQGALDCAVARVKQGFDTICKNNKAISGKIEWHDMVAELLIEPKNAQVQVSCVTKKCDTLLCSLRAELVKDSRSKVRVCCFQR